MTYVLNNPLSNIYSNAPRRPIAEGYLNDNFRNRAILHATYQVGIGLIPESKSLFKKMLNESRNLNAYDLSQNMENDDLSSPEGIYGVEFFKFCNTLTLMRRISSQNT